MTPEDMPVRLPEQITVTRYLLPVNPDHIPAAGSAKRRERFSAEFVGGPGHGQSVEGCRSPEEAIGSLIRKAAASLTSPDEIFEFFASLFGDLSVRSANVVLARAVWIAALHPRREHPGVRIDTAKASRRPSDVPRQPTR